MRVGGTRAVGEPTNLPDIATLRAFVAVADARSFSDGAKRVGLTRSAAGKAISRLEELLGVRLLHRTTRRVGLTADGLVFHDRAAQILGDLEAAQTAIQGGGTRPRGVLRLTAPEAYGRQVVLPILGEYLERWPEMTAEANFTDRVVDIVEDGFDVAIRIDAKAAGADLVGRVVARSAAQLCASPGYLHRHGVPRTVEDLRGHRQLLSGTRDSPRAWVLRRGAEAPVVVPARPALLSDSAGALRDAALAGLGVACLPRFLLDRHVESGELELVLPALATPPFPISAIYPSRRHLSPKTRLFIDLLLERLAGPAGRS